jgi:YidC/Oxa1 family membrane protein insertase
MGGCLPLLIQLPILLALYNIVMNPLYYICNLSTEAIDQISTIVSSHTGASYDAARNINLLGDMKKMSFADFANVEGMTEEVFENLPNLSIFGGALDLAATPSFTSFNLLLLVPVLTFVSYFLSMKLTRKLTYQPATTDKAMGCSNKIMDFMMPAFSVYITFVVPAAIGVYWIFKCILGMVKQIILKFAMPFPVFTEEDYLAAEKELAGKAQKEKRAPSGRVVRSLHHIDDEDFADTAEAGRARREALEAQAAEDAKLRAANGKASLFGGTRMKDDSKDEGSDKTTENDNTDKGNE